MNMETFSIKNPEQADGAEILYSNWHQICPSQRRQSPESRLAKFRGKFGIVPFFQLETEKVQINQKVKMLPKSKIRVTVNKLENNLSHNGT